jgi:hypothetical protein
MTIYLSDYQTFESKQELNHHVRQHEKANSNELTASQRDVLRFIARYSVKYSGASHLKASTIAEGTDKSERTIRRILKTLESLGIIARIKTTRPKSGGSGANIIVIQPFVAPRLSDREVEEKARQSNVQPFTAENEPLHKRDIPNYLLETAGLQNSIPTPILEALSPFYRGTDIQRLTGVILRAKSAVHRDIRLESHTDAFKTCVLDCIRRLKAGTIKRLDGYLYVSLRKLFRRLSIEESFCW